MAILACLLTSLLAGASEVTAGADAVVFTDPVVYEARCFTTGAGATSSCYQVAAGQPYTYDQARDAAAVRSPEIGVEAPTVFILEGSYPNPFNPQTTIRFGLPEGSLTAKMLLVK